MESFIKIGPVVSPNGSGQTDRQTDTHTDTQTDTQTPPGFPSDTITIHLVNEMTKCKNREGYHARHHSYTVLHSGPKLCDLTGIYSESVQKGK